jgi:hypothetical protein
LRLARGKPTGSLYKDGERLDGVAVTHQTQSDSLNRDGLALLGLVVELRELVPHAGHADQYRPMLR